MFFTSVIKFLFTINRLSKSQISVCRPISEFKRLSPPLAEITELNPPEADYLITIRKKIFLTSNVLPPVEGPIGLSPPEGDNPLNSPVK